MTRNQAVAVLTGLALLVTSIAYNHGWITKADLDAALAFLGAGNVGYHVNNTEANVALNPSDPATPPYDDEPPAQLSQ